MTSAINLLLSKIKVDRQLADIMGGNVAGADTEGFTRKSAAVITQASGNTINNVKLGAIERQVDKILQNQVSTQNSRLCKQSFIHDIYTRLKNVLGTKGNQSTFVHQLGDFANSLNVLGAHATTDNKHIVVEKALTFTNNINEITEEILKIRTSIDKEIEESIEAVNHLLEQIRDINQRVGTLAKQNLDTSNVEDARDVLLHQLGELIEIKTSPIEDKELQVSTKYGRTLTVDTSVFPLSYTSTSGITPNETLNDLMQDTHTITQEIHQGKIAGLFYMRDHVLVDLQSEMDELTRVLRDTVNALHNEGTSYTGTGTLTGETILPDVVDPVTGQYVTPTGSTGFDGQGTLRLAVTDSEGTLIDYKDIALSDGMTIDSFIAQVASTNYGVSGGASPTTNGGLTVDILASGALEISVDTPGYTISIGSVDGAPAKVSAVTDTSAGFDPSRALGFSHFFGLNNFFKTTAAVASRTSQVGIANTLTVNPQLIANNNNVSVGRLNGSVPPPTTRGLGIAAGDGDIGRELYDAIALNPTNFLAAGAFSASTTTINEFSKRVFSLVQHDIEAAKSEYDYRKATYDVLASKAHERSGVNTTDELMNLFKITTSQQVTSKSLSIVQSMEKELLNTLGPR